MPNPPGAQTHSEPEKNLDTQIESYQFEAGLTG